MDQKGQISIEFVLILAIMLVIVITVTSYVGEQNELSAVSLAAREGATNAITNLSLLNRSIAPVRVEGINTVSNGRNITLIVHVSGPLNQNITGSILSSIAAQGYNVTNGNIITGRHSYTINVTN